MNTEVVSTICTWMLSYGYRWLLSYSWVCRNVIVQCSGGSKQEAEIKFPNMTSPEVFQMLRSYVFLYIWNGGLNAYYYQYSSWQIQIDAISVGNWCEMRQITNNIEEML